MADEPLDENDPFYAFKKWGRDYRFNDDYRKWRNARDEKENEERAAKRRAQGSEPMTFPQASREGW